MDVFEAIVNRRTANTKFADKEIEIKDIDILIKMASYAPSHFNSQPWKFIIIKNKSIISKIADIAGNSMELLMKKGIFWKKYRKYFRFSTNELAEKGNGIHIDHMPAILKPFAKHIFTEKGGKILAKFKVPEILGKDERKLVETSPLLFAICLDKEEYKEKELSGYYSVISMGAVIQNLWLTTHALNMGMQFVSTPFELTDQSKKIFKLLKINDNFELGAIFRLGYIDKKVNRPTIDWKSSHRKGIKDMAWLNTWGNQYD